MSYRFGGEGHWNFGARRRCIFAATTLAVLLAAMALITPTVAEAQDMASISVVLDAVPDDDQDFEFTTSGAPLPASFVLDDDESFAASPDPATLQNAWTSELVPAGATYSIAQTPVAGWGLTSATCDNGDVPGAITPDPGTNVTCTFVSEAEPGAVTVTKSVESPEGTQWAFDISIDPVGPGVTSPQPVSGTGSGSDVVTFEPLTLNQTYTIIEPSLPEDWEQTSFTCIVADVEPAEAGYQVTITEPGQEIACDIVNTTGVVTTPVPGLRQPLLLVLAVLLLLTGLVMRRAR